MHDIDLTPHIVIDAAATPEQQAALSDFDIAIWETPDAYTAAAALLLKGENVEPQSPRVQTAAGHISRVLDATRNGGLIDFDDETFDRIMNHPDPDHQDLMQRFRIAKKNKRVDETLQRQLALDRIKIFAGVVVADFLATDTSSEDSAA